MDEHTLSPLLLEALGQFEQQQAEEEHGFIWPLSDTRH